MRVQKLLVVQRHGGLRRQGFDQGLDIAAEGDNLAGILVLGIEKLKDADNLVLGILHRHGQERFRPVSRYFVEFPRAGEIEVLGIVGVGDVDGFPRQAGATGDVGFVFLARFRIIEKHRRKDDFLAGGSAHGDLEGIRAHDLKFQVVVFGLEVKRPAVGIGEFLGLEKNGFH